MTIRYESYDVEAAALDVIPAGMPHDYAYDPEPRTRHAVIIKPAYGEAAVLDGTKTDIVDLLVRTLNAVNELPDVDPDDPELLARIAAWRAASKAEEEADDNDADEGDEAP